MKNLILIIVISLGVTCKSENNFKPINGDSLMIDINSHKNLKSLEVLKVIQLEMNPKSAIGFCQKVIKFENFIFVMDIATNDVKVFDNKGKYIESIGNVGDGNHEYITLSDININKWERSLDIIDPRGKLIRYKIDQSEYTKDIKLNIRTSEASHFQWIDSNTIMLHSYFDKMGIRFYSIAENRVVGKALNSKLIKTKGGGTFMKPPFWDSEGTINLIDQHQLTVYKVSNLELKKRFKLNFGSNNFEYEEIKNIPHEFNLDDYLEDKKKAFPILNCVENDQYFGFGIQYENSIRHFVKDKYNHSIFRIDFNEYEQNYMDFDLLMSENIGEGNIFTSIIRNPISAKKIFKNATLSRDLREVFNLAKENDNPYIVEYKLKD